MFWGWAARRRRRAILAEPFPLEWEAIFERGVRLAARLPAEHQQRLRQLTQIFVVEKNWEGLRGLAITDEMKVVIAAHACLLVVAMPEEIHFDQVLSVLIQPTGYVARGIEVIGGGIVEGRQARIGQTGWREPVVVSWRDARAAGRGETPGRNVVLHEFAHQLDMLNGRFTDGTPTMENREQAERWAQVMEPEFQDLVESCRRDRPTLIDCYGATNRTEFFAVTTEVFFEQPVLLRRYHPDLYEVLRAYFRLDPAVWTSTRGDDEEEE